MAFERAAEAAARAAAQEETEEEIDSGPKPILPYSSFFILSSTNPLVYSYFVIPFSLLSYFMHMIWHFMNWKERNSNFILMILFQITPISSLDCDKKVV